MRPFLLGVVSVLVLVMMAGCVAMPVEVAQLEALTDIELGVPQQDVYVEGDDGMLYRIHQDDLTDELLAAPAYATTEFNTPDLFETGSNPRGPYPKGEALGFTLEEWLMATGGATYIKHGDGTDEISMSFENLPPDSVYTVWCMLMWLPPNEDVFELPCGSPDGAQALFQSDADGTLDAHLRMSAMPYSADEMISSLCIAYHSDDQPHGHVVGDYGKNAHTHLCMDVPAAGSELWEMSTSVSPAGM